MMGDHEKHPEGDPEYLPVPQGDAPGASAGGPEPEEAGTKALGDALKTSFRFLKICMMASVVIYLLSGVFWVKSPQLKFKMRFGEVVPAMSILPFRPGRKDKVLKPETGVYIRWPWEEVVVLHTDEQTLDLEKEFWPRTREGTAAAGTGLNVRTDGYLISGDANIVHMKLRARYRVRQDPLSALSYKLRVVDAELILRRALAAATCEVVSSMEVMRVIQRENLFERIDAALRRRLAEFESNAGCPLGLDIVRVEAIEMADVKNPTEPRNVREAFNQAQMAESTKDQLRREGELEASKILNMAVAAAERIREEAKADRVRLVRSARADAEAMRQILPVYRTSRAVANVLRVMFYQRTMEQVMAQAPGAFVLSEPSDGTTLWLEHRKRPAQKVEPLIRE